MEGRDQLSFDRLGLFATCQRSRVCLRRIDPVLRRRRNVHLTWPDGANPAHFWRDALDRIEDAPLVVDEDDVRAPAHQLNIELGGCEIDIIVVILDVVIPVGRSGGLGYTESDNAFERWLRDGDDTATASVFSEQQQERGDTLWIRVDPLGREPEARVVRVDTHNEPAPAMAGVDFERDGPGVDMEHLLDSRADEEFVTFIDDRSDRQHIVHGHLQQAISRAVLLEHE